MPSKIADGKWKVDIRPYGATGPRIRKTFKTKAEAIRFKAFKLNEATHKPWEPVKKDNRTLPQLIDIWFENYGQHVSRGADRRKLLLRFSKSCNNKLGRLVTEQDLISFRNKKIASGTKVSTCNTYSQSIKAMFNRLKKQKIISFDNPLANVEDLKTQERERSYLDKHEIEALMSNLKRDSFDLYMLADICLSTGARWSEACNLRSEDIQSGMVRYKNTKSKKIRTVPISPEREMRLKEWLQKKIITHKYSRNEFDRLLKIYNLKKQEGQTTHILRHSFSAHFVMNGGHLFTLMKILGHSKIETTMQYAHLSPHYLEEAKKLNPIMDVKTY